MTTETLGRKPCRELPLICLLIYLILNNIFFVNTVFQPQSLLSSYTMYNGMKAKGKILEWGNSWGIRLNKASAIEVEITEKATTGRDVWGTLPRKGDTAKALKEIDEMFGED